MLPRCRNTARIPICEAVFDWIALYYGREAAPNAHDKMKGNLCIDPGDMEDFMAAFFQRNDIPLPNRKKPALLPDERSVTLNGSACYLARRRAQATGTRP